MDNILDHVVVHGQSYDIVSPTAFGDYIETIGSACINPDGYAEGSTFLARLGNEQFFYEATAAITQGSSISEGTNCKKTTVTGREAELARYVASVNQALTKQTLYFTSVACAATTGNFATVSNSDITANHVVVECTFANPSAIITDVTWTTANGSLTLNGTCINATTANIILSKKGN